MRAMVFSCINIFVNLENIGELLFSDPVELSKLVISVQEHKEIKRYFNQSSNIDINGFVLNVKQTNC